MTETAPGCALCGAVAELVSGACVRCIDRLGEVMALRRAWSARGERFEVEALGAAFAV